MVDLKKKKSFLEGSVDRAIYRDYIVNQRFFIYCSLVCASVCKKIAYYSDQGLVIISRCVFRWSVHKEIAYVSESRVGVYSKRCVQAVCTQKNKHCR